VPELEAQGNDESSDEEEEDEEEEAAPRRSARIAGGVLKPSRYTMATQIAKSKLNSEERNRAIEKAEMEEIEQVFIDLQAVQPVYEDELEGFDPLNCHLFTVEKLLANGDFNKMKSRFVANGNEQDQEVYPDHSSPTITVHSIMTALAVAACNPCIKAAKIDVKGVFIQIEMVGPPVFIKCRPKLMQLILKLLPGLRKYVSKDGRLYCKLLKALYGCVQASKLWFEKLAKVLRAEGYEHSLTDPCVMRRIVGDIVYFLLIYVDDILLLAEQQEIERMKEVFLQHFTWIRMEIAEKHSYLGILISLRPGEVEIDMEFYVRKVLKGYNNLLLANTPATKKLFEESTKRVVLTEEEKKKFHMTVARLLYLSKRARPDILTAVGFLCTRVKEPTVEDKQKLLRLLGYMQASVNKKLLLRP